MVWGVAYLLFTVSSSVWSVGSQPSQKEHEESFPSLLAIAQEQRFSLLREARAFQEGEGSLDRFSSELARAQCMGWLAEWDEWGMTVAHHAVCESQWQLLDLVLAADAPFDVQDRQGRTPLHCLTERFFACGSLDFSRSFPHYQKILTAIEKVRSTGVSLDITDAQGRLPLGVKVPEDSHESTIHLLVRAGRIDELRRVAVLGLPVVFTAADGRSTFDDARSVDMVRFLQSQGGDIFARRPNGFTMLHNTRSAAVAHFLIDSGFDINDAQNEERSTPLHTASARGAVGVLRVLLQYASSVGNEGATESEAKRSRFSED